MLSPTFLPPGRTGTFKTPHVLISLTPPPVTTALKQLKRVSAHKLDIVGGCLNQKSILALRRQTSTSEYITYSTLSEVFVMAD